MIDDYTRMNITSKYLFANRHEAMMKLSSPFTPTIMFDGTIIPDLSNITDIFNISHLLNIPDLLNISTRKHQLLAWS